jgi:hypothetical protein
MVEFVVIKTIQSNNDMGEQEGAPLPFDQVMGNASNELCYSRSTDEENDIITSENNPLQATVAGESHIGGGRWPQNTTATNHEEQQGTNTNNISDNNGNNHNIDEVYDRRSRIDEHEDEKQVTIVGSNPLLELLYEEKSGKFNLSPDAGGGGSSVFALIYKNGSVEILGSEDNPLHDHETATSWTSEEFLSEADAGGGSDDDEIHEYEPSETAIAERNPFYKESLSVSSANQEAVTEIKGAISATNTSSIGRKRTKSSIVDIALQYEREGRVREAEAIYIENMKKRIIAFGDDHPRAVDALFALARFYESQGRLGVAGRLYEVCLEKRQRVLGIDHIETIHTLSTLSRMYLHQGRCSRAEPGIVECYRRRSEQLGDSDPATLTSLYHLALLRERQGRCTDAEDLYRLCYVRQCRSLGNKHPDTLASFAALESIINHQKSHPAAAPHDVCRAISTPVHCVVDLLRWIVEATDDARQ